MFVKFSGLAGVAACLAVVGFMSVPASAATKVAKATFTPPVSWPCGSLSSVSIDLSSKVKGSSQAVKKITWNINYNNSSYSYTGIYSRVCIGKPSKGICTDWSTSHSNTSKALSGDDMTSKLFYVQVKRGTYTSGCGAAKVITATKTGSIAVKYKY